MVLTFCWQEHYEPQREAGGRIKELEDPNVIVDEFAPVGMKRAKAAVVACEEVYRQYDAALKKEEVSISGVYSLLIIPTSPVGPVFYNSPSSRTPAHSVT